MKDSTDSGELLGRPYDGALERHLHLVRGGPQAQDEPEAAVVLPPGMAIGPFRIERLLARGGMGTVYRAVAEDGRVVALKVARQGTAADPTYRRRLQNEARILQGLQHQNIVRFLCCGEADGLFYLATELIEGRDLLRFAEHERPDARRILRIALALARALEACHGAGLLHRDLSPGNVLVRDDGQPLLVDFGLGRDRIGRLPYGGLTRSDAVPGKLAYLPPEARDGAAPGEGFDLYAFGGCLYALWARQEFAPHLVNDLYPKPSGGEESATRKLKLIARKCLARRPEHRFASAARLREALEGACKPPPPWWRWLLLGVSGALILALFALAQRAGTPQSGPSPIRFLSHGLHVLLLSIFGLRSLWIVRRAEPRLEVPRFLPPVWLSFLAYYVFNAARALSSWSGTWVETLDATLSNLTGVCLLLLFCALWFPTRAGADRRRYRRARALVLLGCAALWLLSILAPPGAWPASAEQRLMQWVHLPSALWVGLSLCVLAVGLGQRSLELPLPLVAVLVLYGLLQVLYPAFGWIAGQSEGWLLGVYGAGMIGKLALFWSMETLLSTWSLFGYEGQLSDEW